MSVPKIEACPFCGSGCHVGFSRYGDGRFVNCADSLKCGYRGPRADITALLESDEAESMTDEAIRDAEYDSAVFQHNAVARRAEAFEFLTAEVPDAV